MNFKQLFNVSSKAGSSASQAFIAAANTPPPEPGYREMGGDVSAFYTGKSAVTFAGGSTLVTVVYKVLGGVFPARGIEKSVALALRLLVGLLICLQSESLAATTKGKIAEVGFELLNSFTLAAAALGIDVTTNPSPAS
jgi:hypothetical protein